MSRSRYGAIIVILLATLLTSGPGIAGTASISIDAVGGRKIVDGQVTGTLFGKVLVQGTAVPGSAMPAPPQAKPLVADAGDSAFVSSGSTFTLLGMGFGGSTPYTFAWTSSAGTLGGATSATALVNTTGLAAGSYSARLTVTDRTGATASDDVRFIVYGGPQTILDEKKVDSTPGILSGTIDFPFTVASGTAKIAVHVDWTNGLNDYDLRVLRPDGSQATSSGHGAGEPEDASVNDPVPGTWTAAVDKFTTLTDTVHVTVVATIAPVDPRPTVKSGGPYSFALGATQTIAGTVTAGTSAVTSGWDTDLDGALDRSGTSFTGSFGEGQRLITLKATDANGYERRETTSVLVATAERLATVTTPFTVIAVNDTGVNAYHSEFSAETYPDPYVLALTKNFTRHPSEYIPGYPKDAQAIPITLGKGYLPAEDAHLWDLRSATSPNGLEYGKLYWIPGTKVIGAIQPGELSCSNCEGGAHVIIDEDGHGSGSTSVSVGNRYGYCPTCLLVIGKGLGNAMSVTTAYPWVDVNSNSWGTIANAPLDLLLDDGSTTRTAVERGQSVLFAAGNGTANAFDTPSPTYGTATTGPDWNVVVGAIRRDNSRAIVGDGTPAHLSSWGDGNLPSACRTGTVSQCAFGGTSAATPYTAGIFGNVLTEVRRRIGDTNVGQRAGQVIASGSALADSRYLADGKLTRAELREAILKTALPLNQENAQTIPIFPYPLTAPYVGDINVLFEGYGAATPNSARRAVDVLLGKASLPVREAEDRWFAVDRQIRDSIWGGYDRDGDGTRDTAAALGAFGFAASDLRTVAAQEAAIWLVSAKISAASLTQATGTNAATYWLHQTSDPAVAGSPCANLVRSMDQSDTAGDPEPCFENRATSVLAAYRPLGMWPTSTDPDFAIPTGSNVTVELYLTTSEVSVVRPTGVLMAGDRVLGTGSATPGPTVGSGPFVVQGSPVGLPEPLPEGVAIDEQQCTTLGELCWTHFGWSFATTRPAIAGEQLTFQVQLIGARAWSFGYEGQHRSKITITPAAIPTDGSLSFAASFGEPAEGAKFPEQTAFSASGYVSFPDLGTTGSGDHPAVKRVDVSVDDATFAKPIPATLMLNTVGTQGSWSAPIPGLTTGAHTLYARAQIGENKSAASERHLTVEDTKTSPRVQWQIVPAGASPAADRWTAANGLLSWSFQFDTRTYGKGDFDIYTRLLEGGVQTAITSVRSKFR
ncbi:MAG TPA: S8 family serine peptidase [Candidatus Limnocylindria bacterium]